MLWLLLLAPRHHQGERVLRLLCRHLHLPLVPAAGAGEGEGVARVVEQQQPGGRVPARGHRGPHLAPATPASVQARGLGRRAVPPRVQLSTMDRESFHNIRRWLLLLLIKESAYWCFHTKNRDNRYRLIRH